MSSFGEALQTFEGREIGGASGDDSDLGRVGLQLSSGGFALLVLLHTRESPTRSRNPKQESTGTEACIIDDKPVVGERPPG